MMRSLCLLLFLLLVMCAVLPFSTGCGGTVDQDTAQQQSDEAAEREAEEEPEEEEESEENEPESEEE